MEPHPSLSIADEGLTVLEGAVEGPTAVDYVFLHGLNGNPKRTWTYESGEGGFFWPAQILTDIPGCRVMMFGYNALFERALVENTTTINAIAQTFVSRLIDKRKDAAQLDRPLVFIAHSLGGLVVKRAIANIHAECNSGLQTRRVKEQKAIYDSIAGIVFMGTPHFGSHIADKARIQVLKAIGKATFMNAPEKLLKALWAHSNELQDLSTSFEKTTIFTRHEIEMCTYYETKTTKFAGKEEVVPRSMAVLHYLNEREEPIAAEHADMTKFRNQQDDTFQSIRQRIQDMAHDGLDALEGRQATYRISQIPNDVTREELPYFLLSCRELQIQSVQEIRIHSLAALNGQAQSTKTATATFEEVPRLLRSRSSQWSLTFCHNSSYGTLVIDTHFDGFTVLNDVPEDGHSLDFIAIPGLGHHPFSIWQHDPASDPFMWLRDSLPPLARGTRVLLYGYDARAHRGNPATVEGLAISLISQLRVIDRASLAATPVVVVAHALAGVVLKQALIELANSGQTEMFILKTIRSCIFLGVPNSYPGQEILASMVGNSRFKHLLEELDTNPNYLAKLDRMMSGIAQSQNISICSGYDTIPDGVLEPADRSSTGRSISPRNCSVNKPDHDILRLPAGSQKIATVAAHLLSQFSPQITGQDPSPVLSRLTTWHRLLPKPPVSWPNLSSYLPYTTGSETTVNRFPSQTELESMLEYKIRSLPLYKELISTLSLYSELREDTIDAACAHTFQWIWQHSDVGLRDWLGDDGPLYWIRGRPGSGKSTLIKYIWDHKDLATTLLRRDSDIPRIKAAFFFHHRGSYQQKSFEGMLHSILFRLLDQEPRLAASLLADFHRLKVEHRAEWTLARLMKSYEAILAQRSLPVEIYLFLDALDEYEGRPEVIVDFIQCSVRSRSGAKTRLKACFSSREWSTFENTFSDCPGLRIHEHTEQDIRTYLSARLSNIYESGSLGVYDKATLCDIEENIATRAQGVFIWVRAITGILRQDYLQGVSILQLSKNAESFPEDLGEFYTDAIRRIPSEYREESFVMFEVILRCEHQMLIEELIATVQCATCNNIPSCIEAMHSHELDQNLLQWVQDRGAGLVEEVRDKTTGLKIVQFMHQTVLDFVAQPGFRSLILQQPLSLPLDNGYTWLSKRAYSYLQMGYLTSSAKYISGRANYLSRAEATTGRSMKAFWDDVEEDAIDGFLGSQGWPTADIHDPKLAFAVIYNLTTLLQDIIHSRNGVLSDTGPFSLLHCLTYIDVFGATPNHIKRKGIDLRGHSVDKASVDVVAILVRHGARLDAKYKGYTPFQLLFEEFNYRRFTGSSGPQNTRPAILELVHQFLKAGQEPNVVLVKRRKISRTPSERVLCSPLHVARPDLAVLLLQFGAKTNIMDSRGLTPLDLSCGVGENVHEIGDHVSPVSAYETAALLLRHGAKLTKAGWKKWPEFVHLLEARGGISIPDEFRRPPKMGALRLALTRNRLALAMKGNNL